MAKMSLKITIIVAGRWYNFLLLDDDVCKTTNELKEFCFTRFPQLKNPNDMKIYWTDDDGDDICIMTDVDYGTFMREALVNGKAWLCMESEEDPQVNASPSNLAQSTSNLGSAEVVGRPTHHLVVCDVCDQVIVGHRYRCLSCHDYDLCMTCEAKYRHKDHVMLRIPRPPVGSRGHTGRMFEKLEYYAGKLDMVEMESGVTLAQTAAAAAAAAEAAQEYADMRQKKTNSNEHGRGKENLSEKKKRDRMRKCHRSQQAVNKTYEAAAAAAAMLAERAKQVRFGEVLHRYIDPANIQQASSESQLPSAPPPSAAAAASDEAMNEARRSMKLASEAAKAASEAVAASWSTFRECAGTFVPVITSPLAGTSSSAARGGQGQESTPSSPTATSEEPRTRPTPPKPATFGLVDEVLKHTPPELKCFLPTEDEMQRLSESVSSILTQFGLELQIPTAPGVEAEPKPSTSSSPGEATTTTPVRDEPKKQQQEEEVVAMPANEMAKGQMQAAVAQEDKERATTKMEVDSVRAGPSSYRAKTPTSIEEHKEVVAMEKDDASTSDTSSASLLTDDDEDVLEAAETMGSVKATLPPPAAGQEVPWILVDIPDDVEEKEKAASTSSSNAGSDADAPAAKDTADKKNEEESAPSSSPDAVPSPEATPEQLYAYFHSKMINWHKQSMDQLNAGSSSKGQSQGGDSYKTAFEKAAKELEKHLREMQNDKEQPKEQPKQQSIVDVAAAAASVAPPEPEKPKAVEEEPAKPSSPDSTKPSTSTAQRAASTASKKPAAASLPAELYSPRPHVNHAIKTMMTMGFSNCDGHLTQLLEALDGDIPRALDMLMQNLP